mgnify:CR=1 FL=1
MERMVNSSLSLFLEVHNILAKEEARFRIHQSTNRQIAKFSQHIKNALGHVFVDFKSDYNNICKGKLILELSKLDINSNMLQWIHHSYSKGPAELDMGTVSPNTTKKKPQTGLSQGSVMNCLLLLFVILLNDGHVLQLRPEIVAVHTLMRNGFLGWIWCSGHVWPTFPDIRLRVEGKPR